MEIPPEVRLGIITAFRGDVSALVVRPIFRVLTRRRKLARLADMDRTLKRALVRGVARGGLEEGWARVLRQDITKIIEEFRERIRTTPTVFEKVTKIFSRAGQASDEKQAFGRSERRLVIDCPACAVTLRIPGASARLKVICPKCHDVFEVRLTPAGRIHVYQRASDKSSPYPKDENDPYVVLQVSPAATVEEIKSAFRTRMQEYHPDRVAHLGVHLRRLAEEEAKRINDAYAKLLGPK